MAPDEDKLEPPELRLEDEEDTEDDLWPPRQCICWLDIEWKVSLATVWYALKVCLRLRSITLLLGSFSNMGVNKDTGVLLLLLLLLPLDELLIQEEVYKASMVVRFLTSTVKRPLVMVLAAGLTYFQASESIRNSPFLIRRIMEATESSLCWWLFLGWWLALFTGLFGFPRNGERPHNIVY